MTSDLVSGACALRIGDVDGSNRGELDWEAATPAVRDAELAFREVMGDRVKREQAVTEPTPTPKSSRFL